MVMIACGAALGLALSCGAARADDDRWIRPSVDAPRPIWGLRDGIQVALWPASVEGPGDGGPRGLLRIGVPLLDGGARQGLINFVAVEPIVAGRRSLSELERSDTDQRPGRVFWTGNADAPGGPHDPGRLTRSGQAETLTVTVYMEKFTNGARPIVEFQIRSDRPAEVWFTVRSAPDSAPMDHCVLTATMGNYARLRQLHLRDGVVEPKSLWPDFEGSEFTDEAFFPLSRLPITCGGDVMVCATTDEADPGAVPADPLGPGWRYRGAFTLTQYWAKPEGSYRPDLRLRVNARRLYWATHNPIPGGLSYENFDLMERFYENQVFVFGATRKTPRELGVPR